MSTSERFDRNERFFGKEGQARLRAATIAVVGTGGLGTHVIQQLALLGVGAIVPIDDEDLDKSNLNRYVGARHDDPIPGTPKVDIAERAIHAIDPSIRVQKVNKPLISRESFEAIRTADYVFGCVDNEGARLVLTELCAAYSRPYIDLASDILPGETTSYGGRVCIAWDGTGCLVCMGMINVAEAQKDLASPAGRRELDAIYGIRSELLGPAGPSVVSINGLVASLAVTEFIVAATGIRQPQRCLNYLGHLSKVTVSGDKPYDDCFFCKTLRGSGADAGVERYLKRDEG